MTSVSHQLDTPYWQNNCYVSQTWRFKTHSGGLKSSVCLINSTKNTPPTSLTTPTTSTSPISPTSPTYIACRTYLHHQQNLVPFIVYWPVILEGSKPPQLNGVKNPGALNAACLLLNWQQLRQAASRTSPQPRQRCQPDEKWFEKIFNTRER